MGRSGYFNGTVPDSVKILRVHPGSKLSKQYHHRRAEVFYVIEGTPMITKNDARFRANPFDIIRSGVGDIHHIKTEEPPTTILELAYGNVDESDIVRLEDSYGRAS